MPIETRAIPAKLSEAISISLRDLLKITFYEIRDYALRFQDTFKSQRMDGYIEDLVTEPAKKLSARKELKIYHSLSEALVINIAFRLMNDERMLEYPKAYKGRAMRVREGITEEHINDFLEQAETKLKLNEWLYKLVNQYLQQDAQRKANQ